MNIDIQHCPNCGETMEARVKYDHKAPEKWVIVGFKCKKCGIGLELGGPERVMKKIIKTNRKGKENGKHV